MDSYGFVLLRKITMSNSVRGILLGFVLLVLIAHVNALFNALILLAEISQKHDIVAQLRFLPTLVLILGTPVIALLDVWRKDHVILRCVSLVIVCISGAILVWATRGFSLSLVAYLVSPQLLLIGNFFGWYQMGMDAITLFIPLALLEIFCQVRARIRPRRSRRSERDQIS